MKISYRFAGTSAVAAMLALLGNVAPAPAAVDAYLEFNSPASEFKSAAEFELKKPTLLRVSSFKLDVGREVVVPTTTGVSSSAISNTGSGAGAGKITKLPASAKSLDVVLDDSGATKAFDLATTGKAIPSVTLYVDKTGAGGRILYEAVLSNVHIASGDWKGAGDKPSTRLTLDYESIMVKNGKVVPSTPGQTTNGNIKSWDQVPNDDWATSAS